VPGLLFVPRVPVKGDNRLSHFTEVVSAVLNSLLRGGVLVQLADGSFELNVENALGVEFEWDNATVRFVGTVPAGRVVSRVRVILLEAFSDPASTLTVGTLADPDLYLTAAQTDLTAAGEYEASGVAAGGQVYLTLSPGGGESSGAGILVVEYEPN
jgi:hypothetical protein